MSEIVLTKKQLETIGDGSLLGFAFNAGIVPGPVTIRFEQSSLAYRQKTDGPDWVLLPEYVPMCLCQGILDLIRHGYTVVIEEIVKDPT